MCENKSVFQNEQARCSGGIKCPTIKCPSCGRLLMIVPDPREKDHIRLILIEDKREAKIRRENRRRCTGCHRCYDIVISAA